MSSSTSEIQFVAHTRGKCSLDMQAWVCRVLYPLAVFVRAPPDARQKFSDVPLFLTKPRRGEATDDCGERLARLVGDDLRYNLPKCFCFCRPRALWRSKRGTTAFTFAAPEEPQGTVSGANAQFLQAAVREGTSTGRLHPRKRSTSRRGRRPGTRRPGRTHVSTHRALAEPACQCEGPGSSPQHRVTRLCTATVSVSASDVGEAPPAGMTIAVLSNRQPRGSSKLGLHSGSVDLAPKKLIASVPQGKTRPPAARANSHHCTCIAYAPGVGVVGACVTSGGDATSPSSPTCGAPGSLPDPTPCGPGHTARPNTAAAGIADAS